LVVATGWEACPTLSPFGSALEGGGRVTDNGSNRFGRIILVESKDERCCEQQVLCSAL